MILIFFACVVLVTVALLLKIVNGAAPALLRRSAVVIALWMAFTAVLAASGALRFGPLPPPVLLLIVFSFIATTALALSAFGSRLATNTSLAFLIGFQTFRIAVELFLDWGYRQDLVPQPMTFEGSNLDIISGVTAALAAALAVRGALGRGWALAWNCLGVWFLANIVVVAVLTMPTPFRAYGADSANTFVVTAPYIWLPTVLVQAAWFGHLLVFRKLVKS